MQALRYNRRGKNDWDDALKSPAIIHFTGKRKPWMYNCDSPFRDQYIRFAKQQGWHVINNKNAIHYFFRKILYKVINKKKTIKNQITELTTF